MEQCTCRSSTSWKHGKINNAIARLEALIESASEANKNTQKSLIEEAKLQIKQKMNDLLRAEAIIKDWVENNKRGNSFEIKLPTQTQRMVKRAMGKGYNSHNITANGIAHGFNNHGENGKKLGPNSIPVRKEDAVLIPYIMTAPDRVEKGSTDIRNRESVRFYKNLSNGYIVVVEKEQMNSSDDMETINFWIEMSPEATNAQQNVVPDINVRNAILSSDVAKIRKDSETAIEKDVENSVKAQYSLQGAFYSNAHHAVEDIKQDKATPQQWIAMLKKNGGLKAGEDKWLGLEDWLNSQQGSVTKQDIIDYINENSIKIEEVEYRATSEALSSLQREFDVLTDEFAGNDEEAYQEMINRYGDDFEMAIWNDEVGRLHFNYGFENYADVFGDSKVINSTRLEYTTEGLDNKREIALTVPTIDPYNQSDDIHFGDAGEGRAVAWIRFGETEDAEGNRVLVIDEIQSKRHQDGREKGYRDSNHHEQFENARKAYANAAEAHSDFLAEMKEKYGDPMAVRGTAEERKEARKAWKMQWSVEELGKYDELTDKMHDARKVYDAISDRRSGVPSAPFEKNWQELAMKRMLRYATDFGFDKLAWTTGEQQAKRYDIGNVVNSIEYKVDTDGSYLIDTYGSNGYQIDAIPTNFANENEVSEVFGKDLSNKIVNDLKEQKEKIDALKQKKQALREQMRGMDENSAEYDNPLAEYSKIIKEISDAQEPIRLEGDGLRVGGEGMKGFYDKMLPSFMNKYGKKWGVKVGEVTMPDLEEGYQTMHSVDVTDAMREDVRKGQPLFSLQGNSMTEEEQRIVDEAKANGTYLKAPNGKASNLNERQWIQVRTKAFKDWFGDWENDPENASKVVDENGEPMVAYHSGNEGINVFSREFDKQGIGRQFWGKGFYFGTTKSKDEWARRYKNKTGNDATQYAVYLNIKNPIYTAVDGEVKDSGYDGVIIPPKKTVEGETDYMYIVAEPTQIKSATDNVGTFDASNPDIRYSLFGGNSGYVGYSMSKRAARAREEGRYPKTDFRKEYGVTAKSFDELVDAKIIASGEWHHTSKFGNETKFYHWDEDYYADIYEENKAVIDKLSRERKTDEIVSLFENHPLAHKAEYDNETERLVDDVNREYNDKIREVENEKRDKERTYNSAVFDALGQLTNVVKTNNGNLWFNASNGVGIQIDSAGNEVSMNYGGANGSKGALRYEARNELQTAIESVAKESNIESADATYYTDKVNQLNSERAERVAQLVEAREKEYTPEARYSLASDMARDEKMQSLLKNTPLWNDVAKTMTNADDYTIAVEALNRLDEDAVNSANEAIDNANGVFAKADATDVANRLERALQMMRNAEVSEGNYGGERYSLSSSNKSINKYDKTYGTDVKGFFDYLKNGKKVEPGKPSSFYIADAGELLEKYGIKGKFMVGDFTFSRTHTDNEDHNLGINEWVKVINNLNNPLAITRYKGLDNSYRIYTKAMINGKNICVGVDVATTNGEIKLSRVVSAYGRDIANVLKGEKVNLVYPEDIKELEQTIQQGSTAHNSLLNADSSALADKGNANSSDVQAKSEKGAKFSLQGGRSIADKYEKKVNTKGKGGAMHLSKFNFMEAWQDEMRALKEVQRIIEQEYGIVLESYEDAYMAENAMSSIAKASWDRYINEVYEPMMRIHDEWIRSGESNESINHYLIAKSGLERNREFTVRDAFRAERASMEEPIRDAYRSAIKDLNEKYKPMELDLLNQYRSGAIDKDTYRNERKNLSDAKKAERKPIDDKYQLDMQDAHDKMTQVEEEYKAKRNALRDDLKAGNIGFAEFCRLSDDLALQYSGAEEIADYSGLTALAKIYGRDDFYNFAMGMVDAFERRHSNTDVMWEHINNNTKSAVDYSYKSGVTSKQAKEHLDQMFVWYVPMKGNADVEAEDIYTYVNDKSSSFTPTVARAKGHTKYVSEDVMALIANTMQSAILQGERNKVKQKFLNMVQNYPTDLFSVDNGWVELQGSDWVEVFPDINENDTPEEVRSVLPHQFYNLQIFYFLLIDYKTNNRSLIMPTLLPGCSRVYVQ